MGDNPYRRICNLLHCRTHDQWTTFDPIHRSCPCPGHLTRVYRLVLRVLQIQPRALAIICTAQCRTTTRKRDGTPVHFSTPNRALQGLCNFPHPNFAHPITIRGRAMQRHRMADAHLMRGSLRLGLSHLWKQLLRHLTPLRCRGDPRLCTTRLCRRSLPPWKDIPPHTTLAIGDPDEDLLLQHTRRAPRRSLTNHEERARAVWGVMALSPACYLMRYRPKSHGCLFLEVGARLISMLNRSRVQSVPKQRLSGPVATPTRTIRRIRPARWIGRHNLRE